VTKNPMVNPMTELQSSSMEMKKPSRRTIIYAIIDKNQAFMVE
jgi:hypothetical protein